MSYINEFPHGRMWDSDLRQILEMYNTVKGLPNNWETFKRDFLADWSKYSTNLSNEWESLRNFVNTYFTNLDVQEEINNKIDGLVADGTIDSMLQEEFNAYTTEINSRMNLLEARMNTFTSLPNDATTGDAELADAKVDYTGKDWDNVGEHIRGITNQLSSEIDNLSDVSNAKISGGSCVIKYNKLAVYSEGYMHKNGSIETGSIHKIVTLKPFGITALRFEFGTAPSQGIAFMVIKDIEGKVVYYSAGDGATTVFDITIPETVLDDYTIFINWFDYENKQYEYTDECVVSYKNFSTSQELHICDTAKEIGLGIVANGYNVSTPPWGEMYGKSITFSFEDLLLLNGYAPLDYSTVDTLSTKHKHILFPSNSVKSVTINPTDDIAAVSYAVYYAVDMEKGVSIIAGNITEPTTYSFSNPSSGYIAVNAFGDGNYAKEVTVTFWDEKTLKGYVTKDEKRYYHIVRKPFSFNGKNAVFCGDSITRGFVTGSVITDNPYPKLFCDTVGANMSLLAVGGALFSDGYNEVQTIREQVENADKNCDFLFIAGGVNDWQCGIDLTAFKETISNLCNYINENFSTTTNVIWITPINEGGWNALETPIASLQEYRNVITRTVLMSDTHKRFSIVQGNLFNFPTSSDDADYITAMYGDKLHPSELGYEVYNVGLLTALC